MTALTSSRLLSMSASALSALLGSALLSFVPSSLYAQGRMAAQASSLPATAPTSLPAANTLPAPIAATASAPSSAPSAPAKAPAHRATVTYAAGMLYVRAENSSLNQILREIARLTGMKITGGVTDDRVFGDYGPAEPATILATLLDGTGSNMLIRETASEAPAELVLTPRNGGATPPNPDAPGFDDGPDNSGDDVRRAPANRGMLAPRGFAAQAQPPMARRPTQGAPLATETAPPTATQTAPPLATQTMPPSATQTMPPPATGATSEPGSIPQPANNVNGSSLNTSPTASTYPVTNSVPTDSLPTPSTTPASTGIVDAPNPPAPGGTTAGSLTPTGTVEVPATADAGTATGGTATDGTTPATSTGPATPEQIFQQLQQLRSQQQSGSTTTPKQ